MSPKMYPVNRPANALYETAHDMYIWAERHKLCVGCGDAQGESSILCKQCQVEWNRCGYQTVEGLLRFLNEKPTSVRIAQGLCGECGKLVFETDYLCPECRRVY